MIKYCVDCGACPNAEIRLAVLAPARDAGLSLRDAGLGALAPVAEAPFLSDGRLEPLLDSRGVKEQLEQIHEEYALTK